MNNEIKKTIEKEVIKQLEQQCIHSGGFISPKKAYNKVVDISKSAYNKAKHIIFNTGSPKTDAILKSYGDYQIDMITIHRKPVETF